MVSTGSLLTMQQSMMTHLGKMSVAPEAMKQTGLAIANRITPLPLVMSYLGNSPLQPSPQPPLGVTPQPLDSKSLEEQLKLMRPFIK